VIVVDTGGALALLNANDPAHAVVKRLHDEEGRSWIFPWAVLPEIDYLARKYFGHDAADAFAEDIKEGLFRADSRLDRDLDRAVALMRRYAGLRLGLVDAVVMAQAERHKARIILTTDAHHFRAVRLAIEPPPRLVPLDG
jgi:predicted nucleic acid-binding protein